MASPVHRQISGHEVVELQTAKTYRPYERLILREAKGRTIWTVRLCAPSDSGWTSPRFGAGGAARCIVRSEAAFRRPRIGRTGEAPCICSRSDPRGTRGA